MFKQRLWSVINHADRWLLKAHTHTQSWLNTRWTCSQAVAFKHCVFHVHTGAQKHYPLYPSSSLAFSLGSSIFLSAYSSSSHIHLSLLLGLPCTESTLFRHFHIILLPPLCPSDLFESVLTSIRVSLCFSLRRTCRALSCNKSYFLSVEADAACSSMQSDRWYNIELL